jgi:uncharacterized RDD family membrane protein YckC
MTEGGVSPIPREARPYQGHRAGVVTRLAAATIDALVVGATLVAGYVGFAGLVFLVDPLAFSLPDSSLILSLTAGFVVLVLYLTAAWSVSGRTYGCLVMGLRVVDRRGRLLGLPGALVRALSCAVFPIGLLWCAVSRGNRSVQDVLLRTSVVYDWQPRAAREVSPGRRRP